MADQYSKGMTAGVEDRGSVTVGFFSGLIATVIGTALWINDVAADIHLHLVAIVIGIVVGLAVRLGGHGSHAIYGLMGALFTLVSCFAGEIFMMLYRQVSPEHDLYNIATNENYPQLLNAMVNQITTTNLVIYAIALVVSFILSMAR